MSLKKSQLLRYIAAASDRFARNACLKAAIKLSRFLKFLGAKKTAARLLEYAAYRRLERENFPLHWHKRPHS